MKTTVATRIPRLPNPLTPETIGEIMKARPYWDPSQPESKIYHHIIRRGFEIMYPDPTRFDAIGKRIDPKPLKPQYITHLVDAANREIEEIERQFIEQDATGGTVHVRAHTRVVDGHTVEVSAYEREAPEGSGDEPISPPESRPLPEPPRGENKPYYPDRDRSKPVPMPYRPGYVWENGGWRRQTEEERRREKQFANANESATDTGSGAASEDAGDTQAGTNDDRPTSRSPVPNPVIRDDLEGDGRFGTSRKGRLHEGIDILAKPGEEVVSPVDGEINRITDAYKDGPLVGQFNAITIDGDDGREYKFFYVAPKDSDGNILVKDKDRVSAGDPIGTVQDRAAREPSGKMENHIHIEIRDESRKVVDPTPDFERWRNEGGRSDSPNETSDQSSSGPH